MRDDLWPVEDREWGARYRTSMSARHVPASALEDRERELVGVVRDMKTPAVELFGDAEDLAAEDAAELATVEEEVLTSLGGGLRPALHEVGGLLVGVGAVASLALLVRHGWSVDIGTAHLVVAASVLVVFVGWVVVKAVFSSGRSAAAAALAAGALALGVAGLAYAASLGSGAIAADDVPLPLVALAMLAPGVATVMLASRLPRHELREEWDDEQWLRRFRGGLRARLVPAATARGHVAEVEQTLAAGGTSASSEFGHPLTLAHEVARADRTARRRRWAVSTSAAAGVPLCIAALAAAGQSWGTLTVPVVAILVVTAVGGLVVGWGRRPWRTGR